MITNCKQVLLIPQLLLFIGAIITNHQRVLILRRVRVEDQGEYVCRAHNDRVSITGSVVLSIQARYDVEDRRKFLLKRAYSILDRKLT